MNIDRVTLGNSSMVFTSNLFVSITLLESNYSEDDRQDTGRLASAKVATPSMSMTSSRSVGLFHLGSLLLVIYILLR